MIAIALLIFGWPRAGVTSTLAGSMAACLVQAQFNPSGIVAPAIFWLAVEAGTGLGLARDRGA